jgi:hypothetical protein
VANELHLGLQMRTNSRRGCCDMARANHMESVLTQNAQSRVEVSLATSCTRLMNFEAALNLSRIVNDLCTISQSVTCACGLAATNERGVATPAQRLKPAGIEGKSNWSVGLEPCVRSRFYSVNRVYPRDRKHGFGFESGRRCRAHRESRAAWCPPTPALAQALRAGLVLNGCNAGG